MAPMAMQPAMQRNMVATNVGVGDTTTAATSNDAQLNCYQNQIVICTKSMTVHDVTKEACEKDECYKKACNCFVDDGKPVDQAWIDNPFGGMQCACPGHTGDYVPR